MTKTYLGAGELASAFPISLRQDALKACATFPAVRALGQSFSVWVEKELVTIPYRLHLDPSFIYVDSLSSRQQEIVNCLRTRHTNGLERERYLTRIVRLNRAWIPPFVVQLAGEYLVEILNVIHQNLDSLDESIYREFLRSNPAFLTLTGQRIASYWDCYYRKERRQEYVGFKVLEFFRSVQQPHEQSPSSNDSV